MPSNQRSTRASRMIGVGCAAAALATALGVAPAAAAPEYPLINYRGGDYTVAAWHTLRIHGTVQGLAPGTPLDVYRVELGDTDAIGTRLDIRTVVNHDRTFTLRLRLGVRGAYFYQLLPSPRRPVNQPGMVIEVQ